MAVSKRTRFEVLDRAAYFAGICWKRVRQMQEIAQGIIEGGDQ